MPTSIVTRYRLSTAASVMLWVLGAGCSDNGAGHNSGGGATDCTAKCSVDPLESARKLCGSDKNTYLSCDWLCRRVPAGVSVFPGACQADGTPAPDAPPYPADGVSVCDWLKVGTQWQAIECLTGMDVMPVGSDIGAGMMPMMMGAFTLPEEVDHRARFFGNVEDQKAAGTCTAFATTAAMEAGLGALGIQADLSEMHLWSRYYAPNMEKAMEGARRGGLATAAKAEAAGLPYDDALASAWEKMMSMPSGAITQSLDGMGAFEITTVAPIEPPTVDRIQRVLAEGKDVVTAFRLGCQWGAAGANGVIPDYDLPGARNGHAVLLVGYRQINGRPYFIIRNSWANSAGDGGYFYLSFDTASKVLASAFTVGIRVADNTPTAPACPEGEAAGLDGTCRKVCADGALADTQGGCSQPQGKCPAGMVSDQSGSCVAACPVTDAQGPGVKVHCAEAGCVWSVDDGVSGCTNGPCIAQCPAPTCQLATDPDQGGGVSWSCQIP